MIPNARKFSAVPVTIWSARSETENSACTKAISPPAAIAHSSPPNHEPVRSAPRTAKNAPISSMPSSAMLTTPLRSENRPPSEAKISGVA